MKVCIRLRDDVPIRRMLQQSNLLGCLWMVAGGLLFVAVTVLVRHLGSDMPAVEAAFIRYSIGLLLLVPMLWRMRWHAISASSFRLYFYRGVVHGVAVMLWFFAMARIPLAEVTAISFSTPVFTALGAILIFHEKVKIRRLLAIIAGFVGMLIILRPGFQSIEAGSLAQLVAALGFAGSFLLAKRMTQTQSSGDILVMLTIFCTLALMPGALYYWREPTLVEIGWLALVAVFATAGHYAITRAIAYAPLTVTQPLAFLQLVWAIFFGYWLFDEIPDTWVIGGSLIIVASITYLTHREAMAARRLKIQAAEASSPG
ncbi:MAG: DMT family transporter [Gammaproteobacteria bacterium]|nr:DMT family transporter [Gammaproteobacteria bacterium]